MKYAYQIGERLMRQTTEYKNQCATSNRRIAKLAIKTFAVLKWFGSPKP